MNIHDVFKQGAKKLAHAQSQYTDLHKSHGIDEAHWDLLTQKEYWTPDQARAIRSILASVIEVSMTIAGMPAIPLPGQYAAALISEVVAPANRLLACCKCPDTFDAFDASGLMGDFEVRTMSYQQLTGLVIAYSGGSNMEPSKHKLPQEITDDIVKQNTSNKVKSLK